MDLVSIDDFLDEVMPEVPGCTDFAAMDHIRRAAIRFCRRTNVSQETVTELDIEADEPVLVISPPNTHVDVHKVMWVKGSSGFVYPLVRNTMMENRQDWENLGTAKNPTNYVRLNREEILLVPTPSTDLNAELDVHASFIPSRNATKLDAVLFDEWGYAIVCGALSTLLRVANESWSNPGLAREKDIEFSIEISKAKAAQHKDFGPADLMVQQRPMA